MIPDVKYLPPDGKLPRTVTLFLLVFSVYLQCSSSGHSVISDSEPPLNCREQVELTPEDELTLSELKYLPPTGKLPGTVTVPLEPDGTPPGP